MPNYPSIYLELQEIWKQIKKQEGEGISLVGPAGGILVGSYPSPHALKEPDGGGPLYVSGSMEVSGTLYVGDISSAGLSEGGDDNKTLSITTKRGFIEGTSTSTGSINIQTDTADSHIYLNTPKSLVHVRTGSGVDEQVGSITYGFRSQINDQPVFRTYRAGERSVMDLSSSGNTRLFFGVDDATVVGKHSFIGTSQVDLKLNTYGTNKVNISNTSVSPETDSFDLGSTTKRWDVLANKIDLYTGSDTQRFSIYPNDGRDIIYEAKQATVGGGAAHIFRVDSSYILYIVKDNDQNAVAPSTNDETHLGEPSQRWKNVYTNDINTPIANISSSGNVWMASYTNTSSSVFTSYRNSSDAGKFIFVTRNNNITKESLIIESGSSGPKVLPGEGVSWLGSSSSGQRWDNIYAANVNSTGITVGTNGITFPDLGNSGITSAGNTLNYYEDGTWSAKIRRGEPPVDTNAVISGSYVVVGKLCTLVGNIQHTDGTSSIDIDLHDFFTAPISIGVNAAGCVAEDNGGQKEQAVFLKAAGNRVYFKDLTNVGGYSGKVGFSATYVTDYPGALVIPYTPSLYE